MNTLSHLHAFVCQHLYVRMKERLGVLFSAFSFSQNSNSTDLPLLCMLYKVIYRAVWSACECQPGWALGRCRRLFSNAHDYSSCLSITTIFKQDKNTTCGSFQSQHSGQSYRLNVFWVEISSSYSMFICFYQKYKAYINYIPKLCGKVLPDTFMPQKQI